MFVVLDLLWRNAEQAAKLLLGQPALVAKGPEPLAKVSVPHGLPPKAQVDIGREPSSDNRGE